MGEERWGEEERGGGGGEAYLGPRGLWREIQTRYVTFCSYRSGHTGETECSLGTHPTPLQSVAALCLVVSPLSRAVYLF